MLGRQQMTWSRTTAWKRPPRWSSPWRWRPEGAGGCELPRRSLSTPSGPPRNVEPVHTPQTNRNFKEEAPIERKTDAEDYNSSEIYLFSNRACARHGAAIISTRAGISFCHLLAVLSPVAAVVYLIESDAYDRVDKFYRIDGTRTSVITIVASDRARTETRAFFMIDSWSGCCCFTISWALGTSSASRLASCDSSLSNVREVDRSSMNRCGTAVAPPARSCSPSLRASTISLSTW